MTGGVVLPFGPLVSPPSPLLGFNNNLRYKGQVFHVQTEDSGIRHPHVITHLFMDGGRILKTTKTSYADHVGKRGYADHVKTLMKEQHKAMFRTLKAGDLDELIAQKSGGRPTGAVEPPPEAPAAKQEPDAPAEAAPVGARPPEPGAAGGGPPTARDGADEGREDDVEQREHRRQRRRGPGRGPAAMQQFGGGGPPPGAKATAPSNPKARKRARSSGSGIRGGRPLDGPGWS